MNKDTIQQLVRIVLYAIGGTVFGDAIADGEMFQQVIGASTVIISFIWWFVWDRNTVITDKK